MRPWLIHVPSLKQGENRPSFDLDIEELGGTSHEVAENPSFQELLGPVKVELVIVRTGKKLMVSGDVRFRSRLLCAICGRSFERDFAEPLASEFLAEDEAAAGEGEFGGNELGQELLQGNTLNLGGVVRDAIHLAIGIAPRCRPDCKGVCLVCGANLNEVRCDCSQKDPD